MVYVIVKIMISDLDKYRAQCLQIAGFCFMTPLAKLILNVPEYEIGDIGPKFITYLIVAFGLFYFGIITMFKGEIHLDKKIKK